MNYLSITRLVIAANNLSFCTVKAICDRSIERDTEMSVDSQQLTIILCTSSLTILGGVIVFVISQFIDKFTIEPLNRFEKTRGEINYHLIFFANIYTSPGTGGKDELVKLFPRLRELATQIIMDSYTIHGYWLLALLKTIPNRRDVTLATNQMLLFPTNFREGSIDVIEIQNALHKISTLLRLSEFSQINTK
jgi:hypothetical protein